VPFLEQALAVAPDYAEAHCNVASALNALARQQEAVTHAERAVALDPASAEALNILGDALHAVARYDEAILTLHAGPDHSAWAFPAFVDTGSYAASTGG
jgi:Tfp pilus assembly protein PilF